MMTFWKEVATTWNMNETYCSWTLGICPHGFKCIWAFSWWNFHSPRFVHPQSTHYISPFFWRAVYDRSSFEPLWMVFDLFLLEAWHHLRNHLLFQQTLPRCLQFQLESDGPGWNDTVLDRWGWGIEHLTCILPGHFFSLKVCHFWNRRPWPIFWCRYCLPHPQSKHLKCW